MIYQGWTVADERALASAFGGMEVTAKRIRDLMPLLQLMFPDRTEDALTQRCYRITRRGRWEVPVTPIEPVAKPPVIIGEPKPEAPQFRFEDDPRARRDPGSGGRLGRPEPFGRSSSGSSLA